MTDKDKAPLLNFLLWLRAEDERIAEYSAWSSPEQLVDDYQKYVDAQEERAVMVEIESTVTRLITFITGDTFTKLSPEDRDLLEDQCTAMQRYAKILKRRIGDDNVQTA